MGSQDAKGAAQGGDIYLLHIGCIVEHLKGAEKEDGKPDVTLNKEGVTAKETQEGFMFDLFLNTKLQQPETQQSLFLSHTVLPQTVVVRIKEEPSAQPLLEEKWDRNAMNEQYYIINYSYIHLSKTVIFNHFYFMTHW